MRLSLISLLILTMVSCDKCKERNDDDLCSAREENNSDVLSLHGFYYREGFDGTNPYYHVICLFKNGVMRDLGVLDRDKLDNLESYLIEYGYDKSKITGKLDWGIYSISDSTIAYEKWYPSNDFFRVYRRSGVILSDTSFQITNSQRCDGSQSRAESRLYYFRYSSIRPDSTNEYTH